VISNVVELVGAKHTSMEDHQVVGSIDAICNKEAVLILEHLATINSGHKSELLKRPNWVMPMLENVLILSEAKRISQRSIHVKQENNQLAVVGLKSDT